MGRVETGREVDSKFIPMSWLMVVLSDAFSDLPSCHSNDRVGIRIVIGCSPKNLNPERSLLQNACLAF